MASVRQFIELAVNMPEQEPQVGQADSSISLSSASDTAGSADAVIESIRSSLRPVTWRRSDPAAATAVTILPASIGPPDTNTVGIFSRSAAMSIPGVILSQLEMHTSASAQCALTMYSTESAMSSRLGSEYSIPPVSHRDAVVDRDRVELPWHRPGRSHGIGHHLAHFAQVHVTWHEFGEAVGYGDDRFAEVLAPPRSRAAVRAPRPYSCRASPCGIEVAA